MEDVQGYRDPETPSTLSPPEPPAPDTDVVAARRPPHTESLGAMDTIPPNSGNEAAWTIRRNPHLQTNQQGNEPTTPQTSKIPFTAAVFPQVVIPYHALLGNINDETVAAIEREPGAFLAIVPYGGGKKLLEERPDLAKDIEMFIRSLGYANSENIRVAAPRAKNPPSDDFGKPHVMLLIDAPEELTKYLLFQQTFAFESSKDGSPKKLAFHTLPFNKSLQTWIVTDLTGDYVSDDPQARVSALATIKKALERDRSFRNVVDRCYAEAGSPLSLEGRVEDATRSLHLTTITIPQQERNDQKVWQLMAQPITKNPNHHNEWIQIIRNTTYLVNHIFPLDTHRVIKRCDFCKNETHPYTICPYPLVEGWKGPVPEEVLKAREKPSAGGYRAGARGPNRGSRGGRGTRGARSRGSKPSSKA